MSHAIAISLTLALFIAQSIPPQPRDVQPAVTRAGTAAIRGRVYGAETGLPVRRAIVTLMSMTPPPGVRETGMPGQSAVPRVEANIQPVQPARPRTVVTDPSGKFEFPDLPAGSYRIRVQPAMFSGQYLAATFGGKDSIDPGRLIELREGEQFNTADIPLRRAGAIVGRIVDEGGEPLSRVSVFPARVMPGTGSVQRTGGGIIQSDDHGRYRIFGLEPGDYIIGAEGRGMGGPPVEGVESEGFVTTYHPSIVNEREATRVRVRAAADTDGIDIQIIRTRTYRITGMATDSQGRPVSGQNLMLMKTPRAGAVTGGFGGGASAEQDGRFTFRDVVPGDYTIVVRPASSGNPASQENAQQKREYAAVPVSVNADIENLLVVTQPGVTIAGQLVFTDGAPAAGTGALRIMAQPGQRMPMFGPQPSATVGADNRFTLSDLYGPMLIQVALRRELALKAIMLGGSDITDTPVEFRREHSGHLQILVSTRPATIEGTVTTDDGAPVEQAMVLIFPEEKESWRSGSPRVRMAMSMKDGKYSAPGLAGGQYFALALPYRSVAMTPDTPPEFFEALARDATRLFVADDERRVVDLRVTKRPE